MNDSFAKHEENKVGQNFDKCSVQYIQYINVCFSFKIIFGNYRWEHYMHVLDSVSGYVTNKDIDNQSELEHAVHVLTWITCTVLTLLWCYKFTVF